MNAATSARLPRNPYIVKLRLVPLLLIGLLAACSRQGTVLEGGVYTVRSACPIAAIPAGTGDITLFNPPNSTDAAAIDVTATITNLRSGCQDSGAQIVSTATFNVVGVRREAGPARQVVLPYFNAVVRGGTEVAAKQVGYVALNFPAGSLRAQTAGQVTAYVDRAAASLPPDVEEILTRRRRPGDPSAAVDPMTDPAVRAAVAQATFEHLVGFQLTDAQLRYNVTR
jgi:transposase